MHWAHPHAASFLIPKACKLAAKAFGWRIFNAYADSTAGEIGTVYQAVNWLYLGIGAGAPIQAAGGSSVKREGRWHEERAIRLRRLKLADLRSHPDWIAQRPPNKGRYVWFEGDRRENAISAALKYAPQPYPKRRRKGSHSGTPAGFPCLSAPSLSGLAEVISAATK